MQKSIPPLNYGTNIAPYYTKKYISCALTRYLLLKVVKLIESVFTNRVRDVRIIELVEIKLSICMTLPALPAKV